MENINGTNMENINGTNMENINGTNNEKRPKRKPLRLKKYDYSQVAYYFITICTRNKKNIFGYIKNGEILLNDFGRIAHDEWVKLPERFYNTIPDYFIVMPNHIHGIMQITGSHNDIAGMRARAPARGAPTIGDIIGAYKSLVANRCLDVYKSANQPMGKLWQRNYYEHVIRNEESYRSIVEYIIYNPLNWHDDEYYTP